MLVLSRKLNEVLMVGDDIKIIILGVQGGRVRIGIEAPEHITVHRQEIYDQIFKDAEIIEDKDHE